MSPGASLQTGAHGDRLFLSLKINLFKGPELAQNKIRGNGKAEVDKGGDVYGHAQHGHLNVIEDRIHEYTGDRIAQIHFEHGFPPGNGWIRLKDKVTIEPESDKYCDHKGDEISGLTHYGDVTADHSGSFKIQIQSIEHQPGNEGIHKAHNTEFKHLVDQFLMSFILFFDEILQSFSPLFYF